MKHILHYLKDYKKESILGPLFKLLEALFELFVPLVMAGIIDRGIPQKDMPYIVRMCLILIALGIIGLACSLTAQYFAAKAATGAATQIRKELFEKIMGFSYTEIDQTGTSTLITRMTSDVNQVQSGINMGLRLFLRSPFVILGAMIMAFTINAKAALVFVVVIPLLSLVAFSIVLSSIPLYRKVQGRLDQVMISVRQNLSGARVIRAFHKEDEEREEYQEKNTALTDQQLFVGKISALMNPVTYLILNVGTLVLLWTGAVKVDQAVITQGEVVALVNYMSQILVEVVKMANLMVTITRCLASAERIQTVFDTSVSMTQTDEPKVPVSSKDTPEVVFEHVGMTYQGNQEESLTDIDFSAAKGQTIGIIGGTGCGKSSLIQLIGRFYDVTKGCVKVEGIDVRDYPMEVLRKKIGMVPQKAVLFRGTIKENLCWGNPDATEEQMVRALKTAQAWEFVAKKEDHLDTEIQEGGKNLSGGQKQRLTIARALVRDPKILILDDSASALDYATDAKLRHSIGEWNPEMTVFIVSQRTASVLQADQILVLEDGSIVGKGTHQELLDSCSVYQEIYYSQFRKEEK